MDTHRLAYKGTVPSASHHHTRVQFNATVYHYLPDAASYRVHIRTYVCVYNSTSVCSAHISCAWCSLMNMKLPTYLPLGVSSYDPTWPSHTEMQDMHVTLVPLCTQTTTRGVCHTACSPCQPPPTQLALILIPPPTAEAPPPSKGTAIPLTTS